MHAPPTGGRLLAEISTATVALMHDHYGRGPMQAKTYALDDLIVVVMRDSGFTALEQTFIDDDRSERVVAMRREFQHAMADRLKATVERLTGRTVRALLSQAHVEPDITVEVFLVDQPLGGCGGSDHAQTDRV